MNNLFIILLTGVLLLVSYEANSATRLSCGPPPSCTSIINEHDLIFKGTIIATGETSEEEKAHNQRLRDLGLIWRRANYYKDIRIDKLIKGADLGVVRYYVEVDEDLLKKNNGYYFFKNISGYLYLNYGTGFCGGSCHSLKGDFFELAAKLDKLRFEVKTNSNSLIMQKYLLKQALDLKDRYLAREIYKNILRQYKLTWFKWPASENKYRLNYAFLLKDLGECEEALDILKSYTGRKSNMFITKLACHNILGINEPLEAGAIDMSGRELENMEFKNVDLSGSDFSNAKLTKVKFNNVILKGSNFENAQLSRVEITDSDVSQSNFKNAIFDVTSDNVIYDNSDFSYADIDLRGKPDAKISFVNSDFYKTEITERGESKLIDFTNANFDYSKLNWFNSGVILSGRSFDGAYFNVVDLSDFKDINNATYKSKNFKNAHFKNSKLPYADFTAANLTGVQFDNTELVDVNFKDANLQNSAFLNETLLAGANFEGQLNQNIKFENIYFDCATVFPKGLNVNTIKMRETLGGCQLSHEEAKKAISTAQKQFNNDNEFTGNKVVFRDSDLKNAPLGISSGNNKSPNGFPVGDLDLIIINSDLSGADLSDGSGKIRVYNSKLDKAQFNRVTYKFDIDQNTSMKGAQFRCARIRFSEARDELNLEDIDMSGIIFSDIYERKWPYRYMPFNPIEKQVFFENMPLVIQKFGEADYSNLNLDGCDFTRINLNGVKLPENFYYDNAN